MPDTKGTKTQAWETIKKLTLELNAQNDADIIKHLESQDSIENYVKRLIRADIAAHNQIPVPGINPDFVNNAEKDFDAILNLLKKVVTK